MTKNYPYLYWPAPNLQINTSSTNPGDYLAVFKYSTCVSACPSSDNTTKVNCMQPATFNKDQPNKFSNCTYYPLGTSYNVTLRYGTQLCKFDCFPKLHFRCWHVLSPRFTSSSTSSFADILNLV